MTKLFHIVELILLLSSLAINSENEIPDSNADNIFSVPNLTLDYESESDGLIHLEAFATAKNCQNFDC